jgi:putative pyruvate formate lyase activating enzyme
MVGFTASAGGESKLADTSDDAGFEPAYMKLLDTGELKERARRAEQRLGHCDLCARYCRVDRRTSIRGAACRTGEDAVVHSFGPHHGEEDCLRGWAGSGTIFFSWCNLRCLYCQNWEISWKGGGREVTSLQLARAMLDLQEMGCHNINLVSPSHVVAQILAAVAIAGARGLRLPLVYNTMKYGDAALARKYSHVRDYVQFNQAAVREMHRQVGDLMLDDQGIARRGLLVRHLVLPDGIAGTEAVFKFLAEEISPDTYVNLMDQYRPCYRADDFPELSHSTTAAEYEEALGVAHRYGIRRLDRRQRRVLRSW